MKCDLHVHTVHSGPCTTPVLRRFARESYSAPEELYGGLKARGMDLVTVTDHDSIGAAEVLRKYPDFFVSEEVTCRMPSGTEVHIGVYDITERQHVQIQARRNDLVSLLMYLTEKRIFYVLNHAFSDLTGRRDAEDFWWFESYFPVFETQNSLMPPLVNRCAERFVAANRKRATGGSDAHTIASAGTAFTSVSGARSKQEFLAGLRAGAGVPGGNTGTFAGRWLKLTRDIFFVAGNAMGEKRTLAALAPIATLIPLVIFVQSLHAAAFAWRWNAHLEQTARANSPAWTAAAPLAEGVASWQ